MDEGESDGTGTPSPTAGATRPLDSDRPARFLFARRGVHDLPRTTRAGVGSLLALAFGCQSVTRGISFDRVAPVYDATRGLPAGAEREVADRLARILGKERTLEIGVGTGRWARPLELRGVSIVGVDLGRAMLEVGRSKGFRQGLQADVLRLPFKDDAFEGALSNHVLHLMGDVPRALEELSRVISGRLRSVLEYELSRPDLMEEYRDAVGRRGVRPDPPGISERRLARRLVPDRVQDATTFHRRAPASTALDAIESRAFRDTWAAPNELHLEILRALRAKYSQSEVLTETRVEIAEWDQSRLADFAAAWRRGETNARNDPAPVGMLGADGPKARASETEEG
jgi:SAM-dependent methyltransferase